MKREYPEEGELWEHPLARTTYIIHSRTDDGWVRFSTFDGSHTLWTMPTDRFMDTYRKKLSDEHHS